MAAARDRAHAATARFNSTWAGGQVLLTAALLEAYLDGHDLVSFLAAALDAAAREVGGVDVLLHRAFSSENRAALVRLIDAPPAPDTSAPSKPGAVARPARCCNLVVIGSTKRCATCGGTSW